MSGHTWWEGEKRGLSRRGLRVGREKTLMWPELDRPTTMGEDWSVVTVACPITFLFTLSIVSVPSVTLRRPASMRVV